MKCNDDKVLAIAYLLTGQMTNKEIMKLILLLTSVYFGKEKL